MGTVGAWVVEEGGGVPRRLPEDKDFLERNLEDWIEQEPTLIADGMRWVARQLVLPDRSRLDLLGLTRDGTLAVVELKTHEVNSGTVSQAMHYLLEIGSMTGSELLHRIESQNPRLDDQLRIELHDALDDGDGSGNREYLMIVACAGTGERAEQAASFLGRMNFSVPVRVVTFDVVRDSADRRILIREIDDEDERPTQPVTAGSRWTLDGVRDLADTLGSRELFDRVVQTLTASGLRVSPKKNGVNLGTGRRKQAAWLTPTTTGVNLGYLASNFPELFGVSETGAESALGSNWIDVTPANADVVLARWAQFLDAHLKPAGD